LTLLKIIWLLIYF